MPRSISASISECVSPHWLPNALRLSVGLAMVAFSSSSAFADIDPNSGIDLVRINAVGNTPWMGDSRYPNDGLIGFGSVDHVYNIGRYEVTTAQWTEFFNAAFDRPANDRLPWIIPPTFWGAVPTTPNTPGGQRWRVPSGNEMLPVGNISWRMAAMYCNWLCNNKSADRSAFMNGAYDVTTFGNGPQGFTDQLTHNTNARYWIPTLDERMVAAHYDPNKNGPGQGGWWIYSNGTDTPIVGGPPGQHVRTTGAPGPDPNGPLAQANAGWESQYFPGFNEFTVPLGAYPDVQSPWGLLDVAGATSEWTELADYDFPGGPHIERITDGSFWSSSPGYIAGDRVGVVGSDFPSITIYSYGLRIASSVPVPSSGMVCLGCVLVLARRRRGASRDTPQGSPPGRRTSLELGDCKQPRRNAQS